MSLSTRASKCLRRVATNKSIPDLGALSELQRSGFITINAQDTSDIEIKVTGLGKAYLRSEKTKS